MTLTEILTDDKLILHSSQGGRFDISVRMAFKGAEGVVTLK
jgi:hypothetical protein